MASESAFGDFWGFLVAVKRVGEMIHVAAYRISALWIRHSMIASQDVMNVCESCATVSPGLFNLFAEHK